MPPAVRLLLASVLLLLTCSQTPFAQVTHRFVVAVVRDDGLIRPIASVDRGRWRAPWPRPARRVDVPIRLRDVPRSWWGGVPFSSTWRLYPLEATSGMRTITIDGVTWVPAYCQQQIMLTSRDAVPETLRPGDGMRVPKHALALMGDGEIVQVTSHDEESALARQIGALLLKDFDTVEHRLLLGYAARYVHPLSRTERAAYPLRVITAVRGPGPRGDVTYFEAIRHYPRGETQRGDAELAWCDTVTFTAGWLFPVGGGELHILIVRAAITSCLLDSMMRRFPLGVVRNERGPVWLFEETLPHVEAYAAYEPPTRHDERLLLRVEGGHCRR